MSGDAATGDDAVPATSGRAQRVRGWPVWSLPGPMLALLTVIELGAVALVVAGVVVDRPGPAVWLGTLGLIALGIVHTELATGIERVRRRVAHSSYFDLSSVWTFAGAVLLPPAAASVVVVGIYVHLWWRVWRPAGAPLYRHVYTTATVVLACQAANALVDPDALTDVAGYGRLALAMVVYLLVNQLLVALALALTARGSSAAGGVGTTPQPVTGRPGAASRRPAWGDLVGDWDDHILEGATLCLGVLASIVVLRQWALALLVLPPLLVLHRAVLIRQLEERANTDAKTGLLTAAAWRGRANRALQRAARTRSAVAVLILDLDHFKAVNDTYGHLAGDEVLSSVAATLVREVRDGDLVGRFGGEEFVVLLSGLPPADAGQVQSHAAAERIRRTVRTLEVQIDTPAGPVRIADLSVSVGAALSERDGHSVDELMQVADFALYAAKRAGRDQVRIGRPGRPTS